MRNAMMVFSLMVCAVVLSVGCTRVSDEGEMPAAKEEPPTSAPVDDATTVPMQEMPDVKIDQDAEIPSDKDVTDIKVPDVKIDAVQGIGDIDATRVDGEDETVDEP